MNVNKKIASIYMLPKKYYHEKNISDYNFYNNKNKIVLTSATSSAASSLKKLITESYVPELSPIIKNNMIGVFVISQCSIS